MDKKNKKVNLNKDIEQKNKTFNGLNAREWTLNSRSVWNDLSSVRKKKHLKHGATFPEKLSSRLISMYSKENDIILDPFLGTGTTVLSALNLNRAGIGIELSSDFFEISKNEIEENIGLFSNKNYKLINGDSLTEIDTLDDSTIQLTVTSPPYADLIHKVTEDRNKRHKKSAFVIENNATTKIYSNNDKDLGNMAFNQYITVVEKLMKKIYSKTKCGGYNVWIVKDYRDVKNKIPYVDLHSAIAEAGKKAGFKYHDLIIWDQNEQRSLVLLGYPSIFYVNQNHSFIIVLRKPNVK
jgi:DNA modification methylase